MIQAKVLAFVVLVAGGLALLPAKPAAAGPFHGVTAASQLHPLDYLRMAGGGVGSVRIVIEWRYVEHNRGEFDWTYLDLLASRAKQFGVRLLPAVVMPGPPGTSSPPTDRVSRKLFARFLGKAAARYGHKGDFWSGRAEPYAIRSWQIMNEVNGTPYWDGDPDAGEYAKILKAASRKIRKKDPRAKVMLAGMYFNAARSGGDRELELPSAALPGGDQALFRHRRDPPLLETLEGMVGGIQRMRDVIRKRKDREVKLRISEFGWGSGQCDGVCVGLSGPGADADRRLPPVRAQAEAVEHRGRQLVRLAGRPVPRLQALPNQRPVHRRA